MVNKNFFCVYLVIIYPLDVAADHMKLYCTTEKNVREEEEEEEKDLSYPKCYALLLDVWITQAVKVLFFVFCAPPALFI